MPLSARAKEVMREPVIDDVDIVEAEDDPISRLLTILPRLKKKPIQLQSHWQLMVIIPKEYTVVWFCSLHRKPSHEIKCQLQG
uniref:Uncharacterized protein n=1 Tax=Cajanus cajan TaxID=3821 RepID=A0A151RQC1_CAJCA|nr:hypothetical protein KK1_033813 [Cajanus cajan]